MDGRKGGWLKMNEQGRDVGQVLKIRFFKKFF